MWSGSVRPPARLNRRLGVLARVAYALLVVALALVLWHLLGVLGLLVLVLLVLLFL